MGAHYALDLAARGCNVVINDLGCELDGSNAGSSNRSEILAKQIVRSGGKAVYNTHSVLDGEKIVEHALREFGSADILINNAGILRDKTFVKMTDDDWDAVINAHLHGTYRMCHTVWPLMIKNNFGRIVNIGSRAGLYGNFGQANYAAAKMGMSGLGDTLAKEGAKYNIKVNSVFPVAKSRMNDTLLPDTLLDVLDTQHVTPMVTYLAHANCTANGSTYEMGGGWFAKVRLQRTVGVHLGSTDKPGTAEDVAANIRKISDFTFGATYPESCDDTIRDIIHATNVSSEKFSDALNTVYSMNEMHNTRLLLLQTTVAGNAILFDELVNKVGVKVCLSIRDEETDKVEEEWLLNFTHTATADNCMQAGKSMSAEAEATLSMTSEVFEKLLFGKVSPEFAYLRGLYRVSGDPKAAIKLKYLINKVRSMAI
jgi:NAD(P)-dependent dehydrogenase (short-subunit alcohol dehydrogenase family)/putative sterol carrier protein